MPRRTGSLLSAALLAATVLLALPALGQQPAGADSNPTPASGDPALEGPAPARSASTPATPAPVQSSSRPSEKTIFWSEWKRSAPDILRDQRRIWLFPVSVARGHHVIPTLALLGATAALTTIDAHNARFVRNTTAFDGFNRVFAGFNTATGMEVFAGGFYAIGVARKNAYDQQTFVLTTEAVIDSEILTAVMKDVDRREAPISYPNGASFTGSWFQVKSGSYLGGLGSMPSGHEIAAFSLATIFAERYPHPAWHRWMAYGLASLVGVSRVTLQAHFTSDTFAGAALGYVIARYVVLGRKHISPSPRSP